jgi:mannose-6-phosphate isomerase-like protein (cupin superfamily)
MPDYTLKNLKEVDDLAAGRGGDIEARFGRKQLGAQQVGVSYFRYGPGFRAPYGHHHKVQEEAYVVVGGSGRIRLDDEIVELKQCHTIRVAPEVVRGFEGGPDGIELIAIGGKRPEEGDGVMIQDWWTDDV